MIFSGPTLREECPNTSFCWSVFSCIQTEYGEIISPYLFSPNAGKHGTEKVRNSTLFTQCWGKLRLFKTVMLVKNI